jgi:hypothetical protein
MALNAGQMTLARPAAIAVHDDRDVARQRGLGFGTQMVGRGAQDAKYRCEMQDAGFGMAPGVTRGAERKMQDTG